MVRGAALAENPGFHLGMVRVASDEHLYGSMKGKQVYDEDES